MNETWLFYKIVIENIVDKDNGLKCSYERNGTFIFS